MQQHQPVHRPHELRLAGAPAHALGDGQRIERLAHDLRQQLARRGAGLHAGVTQALIAFRVALAARGRSTATPQLWAKACAARVGCPDASKAALTGGPRRCSCWSCAASASRLTRTARRRGVAKDSHGAVREAGCVDARHDAVAERLFQRTQCLGRQFLGAQLDQEIGGALMPAPSGA